MPKLVFDIRLWQIHLIFPSKLTPLNLTLMKQVLVGDDIATCHLKLYNPPFLKAKKRENHQGLGHIMYA